MVEASYTPVSSSRPRGQTRSERRWLRRLLTANGGALVALSLLSQACSSNDGSEVNPGAGGSSAGSGLGGGEGGSITIGGSASGGSITIGGSIGTGGDGGTGGTNACATVQASAELQPVYLAFAFDVSGSMGKGDYPWHDATLKWDPIVAATRAFFEDAASTGLTASLTAFPAAGEQGRCDAPTYATPNVPMTPLPSTAFGAELDTIRAQAWRGGTPTLAVVNGVLTFVAAQRPNFPGRYVFVLVTDGYPQGCDDNKVDSVVQAVSAVADELPTYVIGVQNPPLTDDEGNMAPDTVSALTAVAQAGGTDHAFIIDTGNPAKTNEDFKAAVDLIRGVSISCRLDIPAPPGGRRFEKDKVVVTHTTSAGTANLTYDPSCAADQAWHYDDVASPTAVVLCEDTCTAIQANTSSALSLQFTCETVIDVPK